MDNPDISGLSWQPFVRGISHYRAAFSLVEVTLALGVAGFALISVFGLLPLGMTTFRQAIDASVGSQIAQRVINDALQTDYALLTQATPISYRYFDDQGNEVSSASTAIYHINTRVTTPTLMPGSTQGNTNVATVTVQVATNPGRQTLAVDAGSLWTGALDTAPAYTRAVPVTNYFAIVSRNK